MISIYSPKSSERLNFVLDFCFASKDCAYQIIDSTEIWEQTKGIRINYSLENVDCDYTIDPSGLLFETGVDPTLKLEYIESVLTLKGAKDEFSLIFYLLSRYEEHQDYTKDKHGRFSANQSQQKQLGILNRPIADEIVKRIWDRSVIDYSSILEKFECVPSFDIDVAWAYKGRPLWRTLGGLMNGNSKDRIQVLLNRKKDPFDTYSEIMNVSTLVNRVICFTLLSDWGKNDKNISWKNAEYQSLIRGLNSTGGIGIHPGYNSHLKKEVVAVETNRLKQIVGHDIIKSRFHFLRFELPKSYEILIENGISKDYSMGYADDIGFRAGTSFPFYFFNLSTNKRTDLLVFPFVYMDSALKDYLKLEPEKALIEIEKMIKNIANVGGLFMFIWHNSSITDEGEWKGWRKVLIETVKMVNKQK